MITRPLDLTSRLRPPPRSLDFLFLVNGGLIVLFFLLFGSRFVLAPGLGISEQGGYDAAAGFSLPVASGAAVWAAPATVVISVPRSNMVLAENGMYNYAQLRAWLAGRAKQEKNPTLLVRADARVPLQDLVTISEMARAAGFVRVQLAAEPPPPGAAAGP